MCSYLSPFLALGCITFLCPAYVFGKNAEAVGENCALCAFSQYVPGVSLCARTYIRGKIRKEKGIMVSWQANLLGVASFEEGIQRQLT